MACSSVCDRDQSREMGEKRDIKIEEGPLSFNDTIKRAQIAFNSEEWEVFRETFEGEEENLLEHFDLFGNTAITVAPRSRYPQLLKDLLDMLPEGARWGALRKKNREGSTLLHEVALQEEVAMVDIVLELEKKASPPPLELEEEEDDKWKEEKNLPLLEIKNAEGETPLFRAAKFGKLKMLKHMANIVLHEARRDMKIHCHSHGKFNILHAAVIGQFFDVAVWIMMKMDRKTLATEENKHGLTCLQLLSRMPQAFRSHDSMGCWGNLFYYLLPEDGYDIEGSDSYESYRQNRDEESGQTDDDTRTRQPTSESNQIACLSRINHAFWKHAAKAKTVEKLWKKKNMQKLAERLANELVEIDSSWRKYNNAAATETVVELPPVLYNVPQRKIKMERKEKWQEKKEYPKEKQQSPCYKYIPLLVAASNGIVEIVETFLQEHPACVNYINDEGENILHIAVKHRHLKIFELLKENAEFKALTSQISKEGYTMLHQVARMEFYRAHHLPGAAFQLQSELEWYERVEAEIRPDFIMHCAKNDLTAGDLLDIDHDDMLRDAQSWTKGTAQSCSVVAVLVATVVFTAAYAIPGESQVRSPVFIFFTTMDVMALTLSLASVVMFLSVLTSPFELWDFHKTLPRRLQIGFIFMFFSLIATMLAFTATILLVIKLEPKDWTSSLVYSAAFFPVTLFALFQFPLYNNFYRLLTKTYEELKKVVVPINRAIKKKKKVFLSRYENF